MKSALNGIFELLAGAHGDDRRFPPTLLYEEGWMLRLVLKWFEEVEAIDHPLGFKSGSRWYSEARLASAFLPRYRGDQQAEGHTHADGVIGHFDIGSGGQSELSLKPDARQFMVTEAKMGSGLSKGTTRAAGYNQAARNVACMAELIRRAGLDAAQMESVGFYVLAPKLQIEAGVFAGLMEKDSIERAVSQRVANYDEPKGDWFKDAFLPALEVIQVGCMSWEHLIDFIKLNDTAFGSDLEEFYARCLKFNPISGKREVQ